MFLAFRAARSALQLGVFFIDDPLAPLVAAALAGHFQGNVAEPAVLLRAVPMLPVMRRSALYGSCPSANPESSFLLTRTNQPPPALRTLLRAGGGFCRSSFFFHLEQNPQQPCQTFGASHHDHLHPVFLPSTFTRHTGADGFAASAPVYPREYRFVMAGAAFCTVSVRQDKPQLPAPLLTTLRRRPGWRSPQPAPSPPSAPPRPQRRRCSPQGENPP